MTPEQLTDELKVAFGGNLVSVVLFGSAATGEHAGTKSDYNVIAFLKKAGLPELKSFSKQALRWVKAGNPAPLFFDEEHLRTSLDAFPLEFSDIGAARRVLFGPDPFADLPINAENFRVELEHELKGKWIQLRQRYLLIAGDAKALAALMGESASTFLALFRSAARLFAKDVPGAKREALAVLAKHVAFDAAALRAADELKRAGARPSGAELETLFARYVAAVEAVIAAVDKHEGPPL